MNLLAATASGRCQCHHIAYPFLFGSSLRRGYDARVAYFILEISDNSSGLLAPRPPSRDSRRASSSRTNRQSTCLQQAHYGDSPGLQGSSIALPKTTLLGSLQSIISSRSGIPFLGNPAFPPLCDFINDCLQEFPKKAWDSENSEVEAVEFEKSRLDLHQALQVVESPVQEIRSQVEKTVER
ncbi:unnamed protein product [Penicillium bialowiezense]